MDSSLTRSLYYPFPAAMNPSSQAACERLMDWALAFDLDDASRTEQPRYYQSGLLMGRAYPNASAEALQLATDWCGWLCFLDDRCDEGDLTRRPDVLRRLHASYLGILEEDERPSPDDALGRALSDLRGRLLQRGTRAWLLSFIEDVKQYFDAHRWEAANRAAGRAPGFTAYRTMRPYTSAVYTCFSLFQITDGLELTGPLCRDRVIQQAAHLACMVIAYCNDLQSLGRELQHGDFHNSVIVLMRDRGCSQERAAELVTELHNDEMLAYLSLEQQIEEQGLSRCGQGRELLRCLRAWMRGNYDWGNMTYRYHERDDDRRSPEPASRTTVAPPSSLPAS